MHLEFYLGCHTARIREARRLTLDHHLYVETVAKRFRVTKTSVIPTEAGVKLLFQEDGPSQNCEDKEKVHKIL